MAGSQGLQEPAKSPVGRCRVSLPQGLAPGLGSLAAVALTEAWGHGTGYSPVNMLTKGPLGPALQQPLTRLAV